MAKKKKQPKKTIKKTKHSMKLIESKSIRELRVICTRRKIPWLGLKKKELAENIYAWEREEKIPHEGKLGMYEENIGNNKIRVITHRMRKFAFAYAMNIIPKTKQEWADEFKVSVHTISHWLSSKEMKRLIETFVTDAEQTRLEFLTENQLTVLEQLLNIITSRKPTDTKRKAITDYLGFLGAKNVNSPRLNIKQSQNQAQQTNTLIDMTEEEIDQELEELDKLIED